MELENRVAVVTGAARGLGRAVAKALAESHCHVVVVDVDEDGAAETARLVKEGGGEAMALRADVTNAGDVVRMITAAEGRYGGLDILVNNAGGTGEIGFPDSSPPDWEGCLRLNLHAPMLAIQAALPAFARRGGGSVVNVSSIAGVLNGPYPWPEYAAAKAGLLRLTEAIAPPLLTRGVRVNAVAPNYILTEAVRTSFERMTQAEREAIPPPISTPEEVAGAILTLIRDESKTGRALLWWFDEPHLAPENRVHAWVTPAS